MNKSSAQRLLTQSLKRAKMHSRDIFLNQKILPFDNLINQQEGILAYKVINGTYLLGNIHTDRHEVDHYTNLEIMKI